MSFFDNYQDPIIYRIRKGTTEDPFVPVTQTDKVRNNIIQLKEVPDKFSTITVSDGTNTLAIKSEGLPTQTDVVVDWTNGILKFNDLNNNKTYTISFQGRGNIYLPASKVYTQTDESGNVTDTLKTLTDATYLARDSANTATTNANTATTYANTQGDYAKNQGDNLGHKGNYSATATYKDGNVITYGGVNYVCILDTVAGTDPLNGTYWTPISPQATINDQTWTTTVANQTVFTITNGNYVVGQDYMEVWVGGVPQISGVGYTETNSTTITLSEGVPVGTTVYAKWFEGAMTITKGHVLSHELGGQDELDVTKLKNFQEQVVSPLAESANDIKTRGINALHPPTPLVGAKGNNVDDDGIAINALISFAKTNKIQSVILPRPSIAYKIKTKILIDGSVNLLGGSSGKTTLVFDIASDWGIDIAGVGLGGSPTDTIRIENLNLQGNAKALIRMYGTALNRINNVIIQSSSSCGLYLDTVQDLKVNDIDILSGGNNTLGKEGSCVYIKGSNNVYFNYLRMESPKTYGIYVDGQDNVNIKFFQGKIDGNAATPSTNPFIVADNCEIEFKDFGLFGAISYPTEIKRAGRIKFYNVKFARMTTNAVVKADEATYNLKAISSGFLPGVIVSPKVGFYDECIVMTQSDNVANQDIKSLVYAKVQDVVYKPDNSDHIEISSRFVNGSNRLQFSMKYWDGTAFVFPPVNDKYVGAYLVHKETGKKNRIISNVSNGTTICEDPNTNDFPNGAFYRIEYARNNGVEVVAKDVLVDYRTTRDVFSKLFTEATVTVNTSSWDATNWRTVVELSASQTNNQFKGMFLYNPTTGKSYYIRDNAGTQIYLDYRISADITAGTWQVKAGTEIEPFSFRYDTELSDNANDVGVLQKNAVSILKYGADDTGATDIKTALQNALNTGKNVIIPHGTFLLNSEAVTFADGQVIFGFGKIKCGSSTAQITLNHKDCKVTGLTFDGGNDTASGTYCVRVNGHNSKVEGNIFSGKIGHYVLVANCNNISVINNTFKGENFTQTIPVVFSGVTNFLAEGNHFIDVYGFNIQTRWSFDGTIANNKFNNPTLKDTKTADGVLTSYSFTLSQKAHTNGTSTRVGIKRNGVPLATTDATYPHSIDVTNAPTYVVTFSGTVPANGDTLDFVGWRSLENLNINSESTDITITGNTLNGSGDSGIVLCADYVNRVLGTPPTVADYPKRVTINGNIIKNIAYAGIAETHSIEGVTIQGNMISDCGHKTDAIYSSGIYVTEGDTTIVGNTLISTSNGYMKYGIHVNQSPDNTTGELETSVKIGLNKYKGLKTQNIYLAPSSSFTLRKRSIMIVDGMQFNYGKVDLDSAWTGKPADTGYFTYGISGGTGWNRDTTNINGGTASLATVANEYVNIVLGGKQMLNYAIVRASFWAKAQSSGSGYARLSYQFTGDADDEPGYQITLNDTTQWKQYHLLMAIGKGTDITTVRLRVGGTAGVINVQHITFDYIPYN